MKVCVVKSCRQRQKKGNGIQFHRFPFNRPDILKKWIEAIGRENWIPKGTSNICSKHFPPDSYQQNRPNAPVKFLKKEAVPTIFDVTSTTRKENASSLKKPNRPTTQPVNVEKNGELGIDTPIGLKIPITQTVSLNVEKDSVKSCELEMDTRIGLKIPTILKRNRETIGRPSNDTNILVENVLAEATSRICAVQQCRPTVTHYSLSAEDSTLGLENNVGTNLETEIIMISTMSSNEFESYISSLLEF